MLGRGDVLSVESVKNYGSRRCCQSACYISRGCTPRDSQIVVLAPAISPSVPLRNLLEMQISGLIPDLLDQKL